MHATRRDINIRYSSNGKLRRKSNFSFAENTTYGCGGLAKTAFFPESIVSAERAYDLASKEKFLILGNGSNVLACDGYFDGVVVSTRNLCGVYKVSKDIICCLGGTKISKILDYCLRYGLGGLEYLYGIPATIGGAAYMNAGVSGKYIEDNIIKVRLYNGRKFELSRQDCNFEYKHSTMRDINALILSVYLYVTPGCEKKQISDNILRYKDARKSLPKGKSCGCVFKNVGGVSAGKIIQDCNLAGYSIGSARVSEKHCNFIINEGKTSADVKKLIGLVKRKVYEKTSCLLEEEVIYIGDFNDSYG